MRDQGLRVESHQSRISATSVPVGKLGHATREPVLVRCQYVGMPAPDILHEGDAAPLDGVRDDGARRSIEAVAADIEHAQQRREIVPKQSIAGLKMP